jgi:hypothetical protein
MTPNGTNSFCGSQLLSVPLGSSNNYQWKKDGVAISGATSNTYNAVTQGNYSCTITNGSCSSTTATTILNTTSTPTGATTQTFSVGQTLANLSVTGTNLQWYNAATNGSTLPSTTQLVSGTTYYVSQSVNGCEGPRLSITVTLALGIDESQLFTINYNPNPVKDLLYVKSSEIVKKVYVFNLLGQLLLMENKNDSEFNIDLSIFPTSNYLIKVEAENKSQVFKIIKQ